MTQSSLEQAWPLDDRKVHQLLRVAPKLGRFPRLSGSPGCVRSSAWIWLFSSMDSTMAWRGGAM